MTAVNGLRRAWARTERQRYRGKTVVCPVCRSSARRFAGAGITSRPNARCVHCGSLERHRLVWLYLERFGVLAGTNQVLHVAPEPGIERRLRQLVGAGYVTTDLHRSDVDVRADLCELPFDDGSFDAVLCAHVLEYVSSEERALAELRRVTHLGGLAVILTALEDAVRTTVARDAYQGSADFLPAGLFSDPDHRRRFGSDFPDFLAAANFDVSALRACDMLSEDERRAFGVPPEMDTVFTCVAI